MKHLLLDLTLAEGTNFKSKELLDKLGEQFLGFKLAWVSCLDFLEQCNLLIRVRSDKEINYIVLESSGFQIA